jgi:hypothetical protein
MSPGNRDSTSRLIRKMNSHGRHATAFAALAPARTIAAAPEKGSRAGIAAETVAYGIT